MRILQVAPPWFPVPPACYGGTELAVSELAEGLVAEGHEVTLLASGGSRTSATLATVYDAAPSTDIGDPVTELLHVMAVDDLGPFDVVHDHTLLGTARAQAHGTPNVVHTLHGAWSDRSRRVYQRLGRDVSLVAISHDQARRGPEVPIRAVIHHGISVDAFPLGLDHGDALAFVGRATPDKGPEIAIEVARRTSRPLHMAIKVNEPDEQDYWRTVLEPAIRRIEAHVIFNADHERKVQILSGAHAAIVPIQWDEPFGLVMIEAMACGTPVVAVARGAAPELIIDGVTGHLVDPTAGVESLCEAVEAVEDIDPATCRLHVATHFSRERMVDDHLDLYERLTVPRFRQRPRATWPRHLDAGVPWDHPTA